MSEYEKFKKIYEKIDELIKNKVTAEDPEFIAWYTKTLLFIQKKYGDSLEATQFSNTMDPFWICPAEMTHEHSINKCKSVLEQIKAIFRVYLEEMEDEIDDANEENIGLDKIKSNFSKAFIVHGHDGELKESVARMIERQGIEAIILNEKANRGLTIIEKFEENSDSAAAICLFTADDIAKSKEESDYKVRARQNVVFETGYFMGKLGRQNVIMLADNDIEIPSDLSGVVYTNNQYWQIEILKELNEIGYNIDMNKIL